MLLCSTSEDFGISSAGVRWRLLSGMGSKRGNDYMSSGDLDVCVRKWGFSLHLLKLLL